MTALAPAPVRLSSDAVDALNARFASASPEEILAFGLERFGGRLVIASSFSVEDVALIDMAARIDPKLRVITLDTGRLHEETYQVMERVRVRYGLSLEVYFPKADAVEALVREHGLFSFFDSVDTRKACCRVRKVEPLSRALATADAWVTGLRRGQALTRAEVLPFERDEANGGMLKLSPLFAFSEDDVWAYVKEHNVPYNKLHDQGFPSIGCAPCTRAVQPGEDVRAGRWWWESADAKECGLHPLKRRHDDAA